MGHIVWKVITLTSSSCRCLYYKIVNGLMVMLILFFSFSLFCRVCQKRSQWHRQYQKMDINLTKNDLSSDDNAIAIDEMGDFDYDD